ncbi:MAG TPA: methyltransferase domain-containing protein [Gemmatimonadales bacterium]|nr:methyltransferase domain-containing protein [Gemmatimonadales bacterium]
MSLATSYLNQFRRPSGWFGKFNLLLMNRRHSRLTDWGLSHVSVKRDATILDVGCGGGRTVAKLAAATNGKVYGVDFSAASVAMSRSFNRSLVAVGRVVIEAAPVSRLPFPERMFDLVTAVETHFYWPDLPNDTREVLRVLKPGGKIVIIAEAYKGGKRARAIQLFADAMRPLGYSHLDVAEHHDLLVAAGFADVSVVEDYDRGWLCAVGTRPA